MATPPRHYITPQEYLAAERSALTRSEYVNGEVTAMVGASARHSAIAGSLIGTLFAQLQDGPCHVHPSDLRVKVSATGLYTYPDALMVCGPLELEDANGDTLLNPKVICEILSPSTEAYDRGNKFAHYRRVETLTDYLLIAQDRPRIERFSREPDGGWRLFEASGLDTEMNVPSIGCILSLKTIYGRVRFETSA